jgi:hypothetical protein
MKTNGFLQKPVVFLRSGMMFWCPFLIRIFNVNIEIDIESCHILVTRLLKTTPAIKPGLSILQGCYPLKVLLPFYEFTLTELIPALN